MTFDPSAPYAALRAQGKEFSRKDGVSLTFFGSWARRARQGADWEMLVGEAPEAVPGHFRHSFRPRALLLKTTNYLNGLRNPCPRKKRSSVFSTPDTQQPSPGYAADVPQTRTHAHSETNGGHAGAVHRSTAEPRYAFGTIEAPRLPGVARPNSSSPPPPHGSSTETGDSSSARTQAATAAGAGDAHV